MAIVGPETEEQRFTRLLKGFGSSDSATKKAAVIELKTLSKLEQSRFTAFMLAEKAKQQALLNSAKRHFDSAEAGRAKSAAILTRLEGYKKEEGKLEERIAKHQQRKKEIESELVDQFISYSGSS